MQLIIESFSAVRGEEVVEEDAEALVRGHEAIKFVDCGAGPDVGGKAAVDATKEARRHKLAA